MTRKPGSDKTQVVTNSGSMLTWALATLDFRFDETVENIIHPTLVPGTGKNIIEIACVKPTAQYCQSLCNWLWKVWIPRDKQANMESLWVSMCLSDLQTTQDPTARRLKNDMELFTSMSHPQVQPLGLETPTLRY